MSLLISAVPTKAVKTLMWISLALFVIYVYGLPMWSQLAMQNFGFFEECQTPADKIVCGDGSNYTDIARSLNRVKSPLEGSQHLTFYVGCRCGEGLFSDYVCPVSDSLNGFHDSYFSISYFVAASSAGGGLAAVTFFPLLFMWVYGPATRETDWILFWTQFMFQIFYGIFHFVNVCTFPQAHLLVVYTFIACMIAHLLAIAAVVGNFSQTEAAVVRSFSIASVVILLLGSLSGTGSGSWISTYGFWLGECTGFSAILAVTPIIVTFYPDSVHADAQLLPSK
eukprot:TRINITY_DN25193_c0_g1_i1.p1 TRINITY_DN25193_c0_g1~~TRINITY_DN25193_c0_g1_i1.p1  ORF type:complete len:281 (-),score=48.25 TRINITY_DN25193_c0_g1_i1:339-1181(-)